MNIQTFTLIVYGVTAVAGGIVLVAVFLSAFSKPARLPDGVAGALSPRHPESCTCDACGMSMNVDARYTDGHTYMFLLSCWKCGETTFHDGAHPTPAAPPLSFRKVAYF